MPVIDLGAAGEDASSAITACDVCVVGTGPAGATLARELSGTALRVVVLESGGIERDPDVDQLNDVENVGRARAVDQWSVRNRILGGSSHTWGGRCAPFDAIDFSYRSWVPASGWPFSLDELVPYLERTTSHLGLAVGNGFQDDRFWDLAGRRPPTATPDPSKLLSFFWQFSRDPAESYPFEYTRFGRGLLERLGDHVTVVLHATVTGVDPVESGRAARGVRFTGPDGRTRSLAAETVVLAAGGIENARLLLASDTVTPDGLGNDHDLVGRYLMDHPRGTVGTFPVRGTGDLQKRLGRYNVHGHFFRAGFRLSPEVQQAEGLLNCSAWLGEQWATDDPWAAMRRVLGGRPRMPDDVVALTKNVGFLARGARDYFIERNGVPRKLAGLELVGMVEQRPDPASRVTLSDRRDRFGQRLPRIDWRIHDDEPHTMRRMAVLVADQLARMGFPAPDLADWVANGENFPSSFVDVAHPTGTTRMSTDPTQGVVDADGQVHGVAGLYVAGTSVFPTVGHCNPTQMIVAMAIRLADHLKAHAAADTAAVLRARKREGQPTTVLLTGATGRIGRVVLADLLERGYHVRATTSRTPGDSHTGGAELEWRTFDLLRATADDYDGLIDGCVAVLHLAAAIGNAERMPRVNAEATRHLAEAAERAGVDAFCYTSSVSVYGSGRGRVMSEDAPVLTVDHDVPSEYWALPYVRTYGRTKLAGELAIRTAAKRVRYVIFRPTVVVDIDDILRIRDWNPIKRVLTAHRHAHHVFVRDVSDALIWSMEGALAGRGEPGSVAVYNLSEDEYPEPTHADFLRRAFKASGDPRFRVARIPGVADWAHDFLRFRRLTLRNPLWRMRFPNDALRAAGYAPRHGLASAYEIALGKIAQADSAGSGASGDPSQE
ncbi:GMC family oxidoreductase [Blastococcus saxobsidens]|uniref:Choline dehydrogenase-like flavoprotein n=1 Tax=Blastococcus saxobsidens TaxID=138336 RepID=A0A4Q7YAL5_9ACTN|nr:GMC family oxidoreductase [Blastococcus saxobsidens]RZU34080.1 choline dehydrogenase-like flavoprotein [Blastococcus saxobsidens]